MSARAPGLSVVVPCFNEGAAVRRVPVEVTAALPGIDLEFLLVDDGSTDDTLAQLRALAAADPRVRYLSLTRNGGLEAAQSAGYRYATRPWLVQLDCDLQFPPTEIPKLLATAADGDYDVVFGIRENRQDPAWRRWASVGQHWVARRLFGIPLPAGASTFKVVRTAVARTIAELQLGAPYFLATVPQLGVRYRCVPVAHQRRDGRSRFRLTRLVGHSFELLFGHSWRPLNASYLVAAVGGLVALVLAGLGAAGLVGTRWLGTGAVLLAGATLAVVALTGRYLHRLLRDHQRPRRYYLREANVPLRRVDRLDGGEDPVPPPARRAPATDRDRSPNRDPLLVLGANVGQVPVYREAQRRGVPTIAVDRSTDAPALRFADEHLPVSIRQPAAIAAALGERRLAGVVAAGGELGIETWARLTELFETPYRYPHRVAVASKDKAAFLAVAAAAGVNRHRWHHHTDPQVLAGHADEVGFPLVVKPVDSSGKRGITVVHDPARLTGALAHAARHSEGRGVLIEELLAGRDLTVDLFLCDGRIGFAAIHEKLIAPGDGLQVRGHITPAPLAEETRQRLVEATARLCREIGLTDGPADLDLFLDADGGAEVVELNARLPGQAVPDLIREVYGVDLTRALVSLVLGEPVRLPPAEPRAGVLQMLSSPLDRAGVLAGVHGLAAARAVPGVARCELFVEPGAAVPPFPMLGHDVGYLVTTGPDVPAATASLTAAQDLLRVDVVAPDAPDAADRSTDPAAPQTADRTPAANR